MLCAWQYAGDFYVGGVGSVDASTSNLLLAPGPGGSNLAMAAGRFVPTTCGRLALGEGLALGESLASCDGHTVLAMSADGNLTLTQDGALVWSSETAGAGVQALLDDTGRLVVVGADDEPVFATETAGFPEARIELADGALTVVDDDGSALWDSRNGLLVTSDEWIDAEADLLPE